MGNEIKIRLVLAKNIKRIRKEHALTQEQLAELADISNTYIANIECGKTWVSDTTLEKISIALNTQIYEFFLEENSEIETPSNPQKKLNKIILEKEKKLKMEMTSLIKCTMQEIRDEFY